MLVHRHDDGARVRVGRPALRDEGRDHRRAQPAAAAVRLADEVVDAHRARGLRADGRQLLDVLGVVRDRVPLDEAERPPVGPGEEHLARARCRRPRRRSRSPGPRGEVSWFHQRATVGSLSHFASSGKSSRGQPDEGDRPHAVSLPRGAPTGIRLDGLAVRAGDHHGVAVGVARSRSRGGRARALPSGGLRCGARTTGAPSSAARATTSSKSDTSPNHSSTPLPPPARVADRPVVVLDLGVVQLQHQLPAREQPLVVRAAVVAAQPEQALVPAAGRLDVAHGDQRLRLRRPHVHDHADPVARRVLDLDEPALGAVAVRAARTAVPPASTTRCSVGKRSSARIQTSGPASADRRALGGPLADHAGCFEAAVLRPTSRTPPRRTPPTRATSRRGQLQVVDAAVGHGFLPG